MEAAARQAAKAQMISAMLQGKPWHEAAAAAGVQTSRSAAYRLLQRVRTTGESALVDRRHGHPSKVRAPVCQWLEAYWHMHPQASCREAQEALQARFGVRVSQSHLSRVRATLGFARVDGGVKKQAPLQPTEPTWQEGVGSLLLLAAAHETGLLEALEHAVPVDQAIPSSRLAHSTRASRRRLLLTLLLLGVVGLRRTWELRGYTGTGLALLSGRQHEYSYRHAERFLSEVAQAGSAEPLTDALAAWTTRLWKLATEDCEPAVPIYYLDGHRKPVFSDYLLPRGVIGRTCKILGCRALLLLHDDRGHPLLATTHRGDHHLTLGAPSLITRYETATGEVSLRRLVIDREGMAAEFLAKLAAEGRWVVTILRTEQYRGLASFTDVGPFLPLQRDRAGQIVREVAPARFQLVLPEQPGQSLPLVVALIRDWRAQVPVSSAEEDRPAYHRYPPKDAHGRAWWMEDWEPTPLPSTPTAPKLIPIVTTAPTADPVALAHLYR